MTSLKTASTLNLELNQAIIFYESPHRIAETLQNLVNKFKNTDKTLEILTHAGYIDDYTQNQTNYLVREKEIEVLKLAKQQGVFDGCQLINFGELKQN